MVGLWGLSSVWRSCSMRSCTATCTILFIFTRLCWIKFGMAVPLVIRGVWRALEADV